MRFAVGFLACLCAGPLPLAVAAVPPSQESPGQTQASPAATSQPSSSPATQATSPSTSKGSQTTAPSSANASAALTSTAADSKAAEDQALEKKMRTRGYKPEMRNGEKLWCHKEDTLGTRLPDPGSSKKCRTVAQIEAEAHDNAESLRQQQATKIVPVH